MEGTFATASYTGKKNAVFMQWSFWGNLLFVCLFVVCKEKGRLEHVHAVTFTKHNKPDQNYQKAGAGRKFFPILSPFPVY